ncbi:uncharacterized protein B0H18DRAFT_1124990 [Fomitopsis serialis]|uniref:uncharacterized protein n=1 Tax=Fomitopsis serialis TaxID=139415 RepID=UPI0020073C83|nr:uncharacterized protein B0H18DRAFT_1124990 [Neoantrodia serialis]KAH9915334.1 hypothetical protein B0H18DRAFT_1124990 [Neoantrodia serialis]
MSSSDGVLFKLHRNNLGVHSDVFPGVESDVVPAQDEIVLLGEKASTLELLFQYVYRQRQPDLGKLDAEELALLAEAAEKYCIYSAMEVCKIYMQAAIPKIPMDVLLYAARHGYTELCDEAAPHTINMDAEVVMRRLDSRMFLNWILYRESRLRFLLDLHRPNVHIHTHEDSVVEGEDCTLWLPFMGEVLQELGMSLSNVNDPYKIFDKHKHMLDDCSDCHLLLRNWSSAISMERAMKPLPNFTSFDRRESAGGRGG